MRVERDDDGADRVATLDIETTAMEPADGEVVAVGLGVHERGTPGAAAEYDCLYREGDDERELILAALDRLRASDPDRLVTYYGSGFDFPFLRGRLAATGGEDAFELPESHLDLCTTRPGYPSLEDCIEAYGATPAETHWRGEPVTSERFGRELGPAYLDAVAAGDDATAADLRETVDHYLRTDLEGNLIVHYGDIGVDFEPALAGRHARF
jgi:DNA polymerase elongation subunit (family B)